MPKKLARMFFAAACYNMDVTEDKSHPNKLRFSGTLVRLDEVSDLAPHGSDDHRIFIPSALAKERANTIVGMGLNYYPDLTQHAPRRKVGVITKAWVDGRDFKVQGIIWKKDFPEVMEDIRGNGKLGMSMELAEVRVNDKDDKVWNLEDFKFTGASALWKKSAAYHKTTLAAAAAGERSPFMAEKKKPGGGVGISAAAIGKSVTDALTASFKPMLVALNRQTKVFGQLTSEIRDMRASAALRTQEDELEEILAGAAKKSKKKSDADDDDDIDASADDSDDDDVGDELEAGADEERVDDDDDDEGVAAAGKKKMKAGDDEEDDDEEDDDEEDVDAAMENLEDKGAEEEPGEVNKKRGGKNKGSKTTVTASAAGLSPKLVKMIRAQGSELVTLRAQAAKDKKLVAKLNNKVNALQAQATRFAEQVERKSVPPELRALLAKSGYDVADMQATGVKLTVEQLDEAIQGSGINFSIKDRYALKNVLYAKGLLERGDVVRN